MGSLICLIQRIYNTVQGLFSLNGLVFGGWKPYTRQSSRWCSDTYLWNMHEQNKNFINEHEKRKNTSKKSSPM